MSAYPRTHRWVVAVVGAVALAALAAPVPSASNAVAVCPPGTRAEASRDLARFAAGRLDCVPVIGPESAELLAANRFQEAQRTAPFTQLRPGAYRAAAAQRVATAARSGATTTAVGAWKHLGRTPLVADGADYGAVNGLGLADLSGRVNDLAQHSDPAQGRTRWYAASTGGGVWETTNAGESWTSIADNLPTQVMGAVAHTTAAGGTLLAGTGDPAFGGSSIAGLGVFWSTDNGERWTQSTGIAEGGLTFTLAVDPAAPNIVYAATSKGLYRSTDAGRAFVDVNLPTTCESKTDPACFLANIVTDVVVHAGGGKVLAAVGWRAGPKANPDGSIQSPQNGLYVSDIGEAGSFMFVAGPAGLGPTGFTPLDQIGRVELAAAYGDGQNHDYVYAVVQDAAKFNRTNTYLDLPNPAAQTGPISILDGIYASSDFGQVWTRQAAPERLAGPGTGSGLQGAYTVSYQPGVQSWYDLWIAADPTTTLPGGIPARVAFGLEEVWSNIQNTPVISPGVRDSGQFQTIGRYWGGSTCGGLGGFNTVCPLNLPQSPFPSGTTHPDQHTGMFVDNGESLTLVVGNDGGVYTQTVTGTNDFANTGWGRGTNTGLHALQPYAATMAKDGIVYAGLQDNGQIRINLDGSQFMTYGGDGFHTEVDPNDSDVAWEEYVGGVTSFTNDGGKTWSGKPSGVTAGLFSTPFAMDRTDADHVVIGGREIKAVTEGTGGAWVEVFNLGTQQKPGDASAVASATDPVNQMSAVDVQGPNVYVGYCGFCDLVTQGQPFNSGIATNVGGTAPPEKGGEAGWHVAAATGLPKRFVTSVQVDPTNPRVVYAGLTGYSRRWVPPGALGDDVSKVGRGHVYMSSNAGESFVDVSGDLPDIPVNALAIAKGRLVAGTDLGVFVSSSMSGGSWTLLGADLPAVSIFDVDVTPRFGGNELLIATYGRGVWTLDISRLGTGPGQPVSTGPVVKPPRIPPRLPTTGLLAGLPLLALLLIGLARLTRPSRRS